jgi:hypothetical protein
MALKTIFWFFGYKSSCIARIFKRYCCRKIFQSVIGLQLIGYAILKIAKKSRWRILADYQFFIVLTSEVLVAEIWQMFSLIYLRFH